MMSDVMDTYVRWLLLFARGFRVTHSRLVCTRLYLSIPSASHALPAARAAAAAASAQSWSSLAPLAGPFFSSNPSTAYTNAFAQLACARASPSVSYTHLTLPTTPYV